MKRQACQLSLIFAALAAAPAAFAGPASDPANSPSSSPASMASGPANGPANGPGIVKCVASDGHVTLTDQPCTDGAATVPLEAGTNTETGVAHPAVEHFPAPRSLPRAAWVQPQPRRPALSRDVATLKAARLQLLLQDASLHRQPRLAGLP